jgi:hypothetical protein
LLDRTLQRLMLTQLSKCYPKAMHAREFTGELNVVIVNLCYLAEHHLIDVVKSTVMSGEVYVGLATITAQGLDFIQDDGGLSAILGVVTVKLHEDTLKLLLIERVEASNAQQSVKSKLIDQLKNLPTDAMKALTTEGLKSGLSHIPDIIPWLQIHIGS